MVDAGSDIVTVEEQDVTIDGSGTRDPDGDALSYQWSLVSAPSGSGVAVTANTPSFTFRPDVPGEYQLQLTASDASRSGSDTMRVTANALFSITAPEPFSIDGASEAGSDQVNLQLRTSAHFSGNPVSFTVTTNAPWLIAPASGTFAAAGADAPVALQLNLEELRALENGTHQASVTISPAGGWTGATADVTLELALPIVRTVAPYVAYVGEPSHVTLFGEKLLTADGKSLFVGDTEVLDISASSDSHATIDLPPLPAGTHTVRIGHALAVARNMARVVVRAPPVYRDVDGIPIGGPPLAFEYDAERDAIYYVMRTKGEGLFFGHFLRNDGGGGWSPGALPISPPNFEPQTLALSPDGTELLITSLGCMVHRVDPDTLAVLETVQKPCADGSEFTHIAPLADGRVLIVQRNLNDDAEVFEFPGFAPTDALPERRDPFMVLNGTRDRLLYVESNELAADVYDIGGQSKAVDFQELPAGFSPANLSMSADGSRTLHSTNVYDRELNLIGHLAADVAWSRPGTALNARGTRAVTLDEQTSAIYVHDVSGSGPEFPQMGAPMVLPDDISGLPRVFVPPSGGAVFVIALRISGDAAFYEFYVRTNPALTR